MKKVDKQLEFDIHDFLGSAALLFSGGVLETQEELQQSLDDVILMLTEYKFRAAGFSVRRKE